MPHTEVAMTEPPPREVPSIPAALDLYEGPLLRYATRLLGNVEQARDVVQDTFLRLCREDLGRLDGHLPQWLFRVCRNRALDVRKKEGRRGLAEVPGLEPPPPPSPARLLEGIEALAAVRAVMATLPASQQEVLRLKFQEGLSYAEIGTVTGLTANHVGVLVHLGLKAIRARVPRPGGGPSRRLP
jgi:RNA polymerase sigma factor (sigma-70 family)